VTTIEGTARSAPADADPPATSTIDYEALVERLQRRFPTIEVSRIRTTVDAAARQLAHARVTQYLPVLIERMGRDELTRQETSR
jgi:hypothetical protein